jgi:hypothetical protein
MSYIEATCGILLEAIWCNIEFTWKPFSIFDSLVSSPPTYQGRDENEPKEDRCYKEEEHVKVSGFFKHAWL